MHGDDPSTILPAKIAWLPDEVIVARDRKSMGLVWPEGSTAMLSALALRTACRCAWCTRDRALDRFTAPDGDIAIASVDEMGSHGLHVTFSDGHARGLYPWLYLDLLARESASQPSSHAAGEDADALQTPALIAQDRCS